MVSESAHPGITIALGGGCGDSLSLDEAVAFRQHMDAWLFFSSLCGLNKSLLCFPHKNQPFSQHFCVQALATVMLIPLGVATSRP